jgi:DNA-binding NarL/FixJ family response regulator
MHKQPQPGTFEFGWWSPTITVLSEAWYVRPLQQHPHFEVCGEAENGAEAIQELKRVRPDVVVLNVTMPVVNGLQAAQEIKKQVPETAIVILSSHADKYFIAEAKKVGVRAYVPKSKIGQALVEALEAAVKGDNFIVLE